MAERDIRRVCKTCYYATLNTGSPRLTTVEQTSSSSSSSSNERQCKVCGHVWQTVRVVKGSWNKWRIVQDRPSDPVYLVCSRSNDCADDNCKMAHNNDELAVWKTERDRECGVDEARPRPFPESILTTATGTLSVMDVRVESCRAYCQYGQCSSGQHCTYAHTVSELKSWREELQRRQASFGPAVPAPVTDHRHGNRASARIRPRPKMPWIRRFQICFSVAHRTPCHNGDRCTYAHSEEERMQWNNPLINIRMPGRGGASTGPQEWSFIEEIRQQISCLSPREVMRDKNNVEIRVEGSESNFIRTSNPTMIAWKFAIRLPHGGSCMLQSVILAESKVKNVTIKSAAQYSNGKLEQTYNPVSSGQGILIQSKISAKTFVFIKIVYQPQTANTRQIVVFQFQGFRIGRPIVVEYTSPESQLSQDSVASTRTRLKSQEQRAKATLINSRSLFWEEQFELVAYATSTLDCHSDLPSYPIPCEIHDQLKKGEFDNQENELTERNYRGCLHILLFIEEVERRARFQRFDLYGVEMEFGESMQIDKGRMVSVGVEDARLCMVTLNVDIDDHELSLSTWCTALIRPITDDQQSSPVVYEAALEALGSNAVIMKLPLSSVEKCSNVKVDIRFSMYRDDFRRYHHAIDQLSLDVVFPRLDRAPEEMLTAAPKILNERGLENEIKHNVLNESQQAVLDSMLKLENRHIPTILSGPFGTGKTRSLVEAVLLLLQYLPAAKVLVCTHVNVTADNYVKDLHAKWTGLGGTKLSMLRFLPPSRRVNTVDVGIRQYCKVSEGGKQFVYPDVNELLACQCVVTAVSSADQLLFMGVPKTHFTHIIIDETAQMIEPSAIIPLSLASLGCKIVLAGDTMQVEPVVQSSIARKYNLHRSVLERLYFHPVYEAVPMLRIDLLLNYRCVREILELASDLFYQGRVRHCHVKKAGGPQDRSPLTFINVSGSECRNSDSPSFFNSDESTAVIQEVRKFVDGGLQQDEIGVVTPYAKQVELIRGGLRRKKLYSVRVMTMRALQGHEFRAVIATTVRTCGSDKDRNPDDPMLGFLSGPKIFNTLVTRAEEWLVVVGNAMTLITVGNNRGHWNHFLTRSSRLAGFYSDTNEDFATLCEKTSSMHDMIANATDPEYMPRDLPRASTLPGNQASIQMIRAADPEKRKRMFWAYLEPDVRELYPLNYHQILGVLVGWEVEDLFDMLADGWLMKSKVEEVALDLGVAVVPERDILDDLGDILHDSSLELSGNLGLPPPPAAAALSAQQQDYQFQRGVRPVPSRLSTSAAEFTPQGFMQQQQAMQATPPPDNNGDASSSAGSLMHQGGDPSLTGVNSTHYDQMLPPMDQPAPPQPSSSVATAVNGSGGDEMSTPTWNADANVEDHLRAILGQENHVMMDIGDLVTLLKERVMRQLGIVPSMTDSVVNPGQLVQVLIKMSHVLDRQAKHLADRRNLLALQQADHDQLCDLAHEHRAVLGKLDELALSSDPLLTDGQQQQQQQPLPGHQRQQQAPAIAPQQDDLPQHPKQQQQQQQQDSSSHAHEQNEQQQQRQQQLQQQQDGTLSAQQAQQRRPQTRSQTVQQQQQRRTSSDMASHAQTQPFPTPSLSSLSTRDHRDSSIPPGYYAQYHNATAAAQGPRHAAPQAMTMPGMHALPHRNASATAAASGAYSPLTQRQANPYLAAGNLGRGGARPSLLGPGYQHAVPVAAAGQALPSYAPSRYHLPGLPRPVSMLPPPGAQHPATATTGARPRLSHP